MTYLVSKWQKLVEHMAPSCFGSAAVTNSNLNFLHVFTFSWLEQATDEQFCSINILKGYFSKLVFHIHKVKVQNIKYKHRVPKRLSDGQYSYIL